jgi:hypothetical protein
MLPNAFRKRNCFVHYCFGECDYSFLTRAGPLYRLLDIVFRGFLRLVKPSEIEPGAIEPEKESFALGVQFAQFFEMEISDTFRIEREGNNL